MEGLERWRGVEGLERCEGDGRVREMWRGGGVREMWRGGGTSVKKKKGCGGMKNGRGQWIERYVLVFCLVSSSGEFLMLCHHGAGSSMLEKMNERTVGR